MVTNRKFGWSAARLAVVVAIGTAQTDPPAVSSQFYAAIRGNDNAKVETLLREGAPVNVRDRRGGATPLMHAAAFGSLETMQLLINKGPDVNARSAAGATALMWAVTDLAKVRLLFDLGADVNAISLPPQIRVKNSTIAIGSFTPRVLASALGPVAVVNTLIDAGAVVNAKEERGMTPLMYAAATDHGDLEIIKTLVARDANLKATTLDGETATDWARKSGATPALALLEGAGGKATAPASRTLPEPAPTMIRPAVERSVALLERATGTFFVNSACGACHAQSVTDFAVSAARRAGLRVNEVAATQRANGAVAVFDATAPRLLERFDAPGAPDLGLYALGALTSAGYAPDRATDAMVFNLMALQRADGKWHLGGGGFIRPPLGDGDFTRTALGIRALTVYGLPARDREMKERTARAVAWLRAAQPRSGEDRSFRLLGLTWGQAERSLLEQSARHLVALQRADGG